MFKEILSIVWTHHMTRLINIIHKLQWFTFWSTNSLAVFHKSRFMAQIIFWFCESEIKFVIEANKSNTKSCCKMPRFDESLWMKTVDTCMCAYINFSKGMYPPFRFPRRHLKSVNKCTVTQLTTCWMNISEW